MLVLARRSEAVFARSQITHQACEEGWSFIAEWTGVPLSYVLNLVGVRPEAKWGAFPFDESWDSLDMPDALHPQTFLAYGMNGRSFQRTTALQFGYGWRSSWVTRASSIYHTSR